MSDSPKVHERGSMLPLVAMIDLLLLGGLVAIDYLDRPVLGGYLAMGFLQAQAGLFCILGGTLGRSWISSFLQAAVLVVISGLFFVVMKVNNFDTFAIEVLITISGTLLPLLFCGCLPFLLMRSLVGGHLSRQTTELVEPYSLRMGDFFLGMTVIAALLASANTVVGFLSEGEGFASSEYLIAVLIAPLASAVAVVPVSIFYFRGTTRRGRITVLFLFAILGLCASGGIVIGFELWGGVDLWSAIQRSASTMLYLATATIVFSMGLIVLYASGYRWRTIAKLSITKESADWLENSNTVSTAIGYRKPNRIAAAFIVVASVAITVSVAHLKRERLRRVVSHTKLNSTIVHEGGYVEQEGFAAISLQLPSNSDCSNLDLFQFRGLSRISLSGSQVTESVLRSIGKSTSLRFVDLSHTSIDDSNARHLNDRRFFLTKLSLAGTQLSVIGINEVIAGCPTFALDLGELNLDDEAVSQLKLQAFKMNSRGLILRGNPITDKSLVHLNGISELDLSDTKCTGSELEQLTQVASLKLDGITVDDAGIVKLLSVNSVITSLSLRNTQVTDETLKAIAQHNSVSELELGDGEITSEGLIAIAFAPSERLALNSRKFNGTLFANWKPSIRCLDMSHSGLCDADIHHLEQLSALQELSLTRCDVSDQSLDKLVALNLTKLDLTGTKVTATAVVKHFPKTTVVFLAPSQCSQEELEQSNKVGLLRIGPRFDAKRY